MQEQEENIQFDNMPDFGGMFATKTDNWDDDKMYDSLYEELCDKCRPSKFIGDTSDNKAFLLANQLYSELTSKKGCKDSELVEFRDRAMTLLGIHISTKKLYEWLDRYLNPEVYDTMKPYDAERVAQAGEYYMRMRECRDDIHALECLKKDASDFIEKRLEEERAELIKRKRKEIMDGKEKQFDTILLIIFILFVIIALILGLYLANK